MKDEKRTNNKTIEKLRRIDERRKSRGSGEDGTKKEESRDRNNRECPSETREINDKQGRSDKGIDYKIYKFTSREVKMLWSLVDVALKAGGLQNYASCQQMIRAFQRNELSKIQSKEERLNNLEKTNGDRLREQANGNK